MAALPHLELLRAESAAFSACLDGDLSAPGDRNEGSEILAGPLTP